MFMLLTLALAGVPATDAERAAALQKVYDTYDFGFPKVATIDAAALQVRLEKQDVVLVDVRPKEERDVSVLPGAISLDDYNGDRSRFAEKQVVTYCTVGVRSGFTANKLRKDGVDVLNFEGSILAWTHLGGKLVTPAGEPTKQVHVYGRRWDYAADGYEPVITIDGTVTPTRDRPLPTP